MKTHHIAGLVCFILFVFGFAFTIAYGVYATVRQFSTPPRAEIIMTNVAAVLPPGALSVRVEYTNRVEVFLT